MPSSRFKQIWDPVILVILLYTATVAPFQAAFSKEIHHSDTADVVNGIVDMLFVVDLVVMFLTPYHRHDQTLETDFKRIANNYIKGSFLIDFIACLPTEFFELLGIGEEEKDYRYGEDQNQDGRGPGTSGNNKLLRLARLQRIYRLARIVRIVKIVKVVKYLPLFNKFFFWIDTNKALSRILQLTFVIGLAVHLFACFFYLCAKLYDFESNTWVNQVGLLDADAIASWQYSLYWAFQTQTTVGYGDFGAYNGWEITVTMVWMLVGAFLYQVVFASLTSIVTEDSTTVQSLNAKLQALDEFAYEVDLDPTIHLQIKKFLKKNYTEIFSKDKMEGMINELPPTLKEEVFFNQFGNLIQSLDFFNLLGDNECKWGLVREMSKLEYNKGDKIYNDQELADSIFLVYKGVVKLYAENGYPFAIYRKGETFGDIDVFCGTRRNGTAITTEDCLFYKVHKNNIDDILMDHPKIRREITSRALHTNKTVTQ